MVRLNRTRETTRASALSSPSLIKDARDRCTTPFIARRASVSYRQIAGLYYDQVKDPKYSVASSVLSAAEQARIEATRKEATVLATRFAVTAEGLNAKDPDFLAQRSIRLGTRLIFFARWLAPELWEK